MTTDKDSAERGLIADLRSVPSPEFFIFAAVSLFCGLYIFGINKEGIITSLFMILLSGCAVADLRSRIVPDLIIILIALLGVVYFILVEGWSFNGLLSRLIGAICVSVPMLILSLIIKGAFGGGDIKLMAAAGLYLGWATVLSGAAAGLFVSGMYGIYLLLLKKAGPHAKIRIAPFLSLGLAFSALFGDILIAFILGQS